MSNLTVENHWFACPFSRMLIAPGLVSELEQVDGVRVVERSDCYSRGRAVIKVDNRIGNRRYSLDLRLEDGWAVHEPIDDEHARIQGFVDRRKKVEKILRAYGIQPVVATQEEFEEYVREFVKS